MTEEERQPEPAGRGDRQPSTQSAPRPWRTEGLPNVPPTKPRPAWTRWAMWLLAYLALFAVLTFQDQQNGPEAVSYTEFKAEVAKKNVAEVFARGDSIQGALKRAVPVPDQKD